MHTQSVRTLSRLLVTLASVGIALAWCPRSLAVGVPARPASTTGSETDPNSTTAATPAAHAADETLDSPSTDALPAGPVPERLLQWEFSYKGRRLKTQGTVLTRADPLPDGTYEIVGITGKRNKRDIERLVPHGELMTMYGLLFSDNRLWTQPPYLTQSGFTFHTGSGVYFNLCYTGPYEGCGDVTHKDYRPGYYETDFRGEQRPVEFTLRRTSTVIVAVVQPLEQDLPLDVIRTCDSKEAARDTVALAAAGTMASLAPPGLAPAAASPDLACGAAELERNRL